MARAKAVYDVEARDKTQRAFDSINRRFGGLTTTARSTGGAVAAALAAGFSVRAIISDFNRLVDESDELNKQARFLADGNAEALATLQRVFEFAGSSAETAGRVLERLPEVLARAREEGGELGEALSSLGIGRETQNALQAFGELLGNFEGSDAQVAALGRVFGRRLAADVQAVTANLEGTIARAGELARVQAFVDPEFRAGAEELNDTLVEIGALVDAIKTSELVPVIDAINAALDFTVELLTRVREFQLEQERSGAGAGGEVSVASIGTPFTPFGPAVLAGEAVRALLNRIAEGVERIETGSTFQ